MTNVLIEGYEHMPSYDLTVRDMNRFSKHIPILVRAKLTREITSADISWCDVLVSVRGNNPLSEYVAKRAKKADRKVLIVLDDDLMLYKSSHPYYDRLFANSLRNILKISDGLITTSRYLGEKYKQAFGIKYVYVDTPVDDNQIKAPKALDPTRPIRIVYAAGPLHKLFFDSLISPILPHIEARYGDRLSITVIGPDVDVSTANLNVNKIASMPMKDYRAFMMENDFDIGLAPLFNSEFCKSKYFNKYIEYSMYRIPAVYSDVMPYNLIVRDGENGMLAENVPNIWFRKICQLIDDEGIRNACEEGAVTQMLNEFNTKQIAGNMYEGMIECFSYKAPPLGKGFRINMPLVYLYSSTKRLLSAYWHEKIKK